MKIAVSLGFAPSQVRQWPNQDIIDLMAYDRLEPFGAVRDNWHMAVQAQLFASANTRKGRKPPSVSDFMYKHPEESKESNKQGFLSFLRAKAVKNGNR